MVEVRPRSPASNQERYHTLNPPATLLRTQVAGATERQRGYGQALLGCKACLTAWLGACPAARVA